MNINIFIRKKTKYYEYSIERFAKQLEKSKTEQININIIRCPLTSKGLINRIYLIIWSFFHQGDVNHILGDINFISLLMKKDRTINTFLDCRLLNEFKGFKRIIYKFFWFHVPVMKSNLTTFISKFTKLQIEKNLNNKIDRSYVIPVPLFDDFIFKINKNKKKKILIVGTLPHKNIENMIKSTIGLNVDLTIVGKLNTKLKTLCQDKQIEIKNYVSVSNNKIKLLYKQSDILLMVSEYEGFGMPILEAQASGVAVITSNKEPMKSIAGKHALFSNPKKIKQIKNQIIKILEDKKLFIKLIKQSKLNSSYYSSDKICKKYHQLYLKLHKYDN